MMAMLPEDKRWPVNEMWGIHDFCNSAQGAASYMDAVKRYGEPLSLKEFCRQAQMVNMENHKAMFESFSGIRSNGVLMWMSHPAWPSTVWQTYDYYLEQTAGYYGCKKASEPLHILWNHSSNAVKVANNTGETCQNLKAEAALYNMDGKLLYTKEADIATIGDEVVSCLSLHYPDPVTPVHFIKLKLTQGGELLSDNFYWRGKTYQDYASLRRMNRVHLQGEWNDSLAPGTHYVTARITNPGEDIALMIRLKVLKSDSGERVLPVFFSDNYFSLLPGETKVITLEYAHKHLAGAQAKIVAEGWNVEDMELGAGGV
jgi:hypothetical protein